MKNKYWKVVRIPGGDLVSELAGDFLLEIGADGFTCVGLYLNVFFRKDVWSPSIEKQIQAKINSLIESEILPDAPFVIDEVEQEDWVGRWRRAIGPVRAGKHFVIIPSGIETPLEENDIALNIEPRMAFGTGEHETTRMALAFLEKTVKPGDSVVDLGCGNGILSIGALSLGAEKVLALDNEPESYQETLENGELLGFTDKLTVSLVDVLDYKIPGKFDLMVANIFVTPILQGFPNWKSCLKEGANVVFTGVREKEESSRLINEMKKMGFDLIESQKMDIWFAGLFRASYA